MRKAMEGCYFLCARDLTNATTLKQIFLAMTKRS